MLNRVDKAGRPYSSQAGVSGRKLAMKIPVGPLDAWPALNNNIIGTDRVRKMFKICTAKLVPAMSALA